MTFRHLEAFLCAADEGSLTRAAQRLFISPPALMQQIGLLEKEVGVALFSRSPRGVELTPAGHRFYDGARQLTALREVVMNDTRAAANEVVTQLRMGSIGGLVPDFYPTISVPFMERYPEVQVTHVCMAENDLLNAMAHGELDVLEYYDSPKIAQAGLQFIPLVHEGRAGLMSPRHRLAKKTHVAPEELAGESLYVYRFERVPGFYEYFARNYPSVRIVEARITENRQPFESVFTLCGAGNICVIPPRCAAQFGPLVSASIDLPMRWRSGLVCAAHPTPVVRHLIDMARQLYGASS